MITLSDVIELLEKYQVTDGFIVGGVIERGVSHNDVDIITDAELPAPFHVIRDSEKPQGKAAEVKKLVALKQFLSSFKFMKPVKTESESQEYYDINEFKSFKGEYSVEPKWDGIRVAAAKAGAGILIITDEGRNIEDKLPNIAEEMRKIPYDTVVLDCELVVYIRGKRGDHSHVTAYLNSKSPAEDYHIKLKPFDVVYADGKDVRDKQLRERKELLSKVAWGEYIHPVRFTVAKDSAVVPAIMEQSTNEGAMIKDMESTYNVQGKGWYKWKRQFTVDAKVTAVRNVTGGYIYTCEAGGGTIGDTYATKIEAKVGDIIEVSVDHVTKKESGFTWYAPKVAALRKDKTAPDTAAVLEKMAAEKKVETNAADAEESQGKPMLEGDFVLHEHWWGEKHHFDLRFKKTNSEGKAVMIGFTLFADSLEELKSRLESGGKLLAKEKAYHAPEWLTFHGDIPPGESGNPTKNLTAHMEIRDKGHYSFAKREADFVDMTLNGRILNGRYYARKVPVLDSDEDPDKGPKPGDKQPEGQASASEISQDRNNKWLFWKASEKKADSADRMMFADSAGVQIDGSKLVDTKEGLLVKDAIIARAMILDYQGKKVLRTPKVLAESALTVQRMMVVDDHPRSRVIIDVSDIKGRVLPETVKVNNDALIGDLLVKDSTLAEKIRKGKRDLSPGYYADIIEQAGKFNDEKYDAVQRNILYDHLAIVSLGRCPMPKCGIVDWDDSVLTEGDLEMGTEGIRDAATLTSHMASYKAMMESMEGMLKQAPEATRSQMVALMNKMKSLMGMMMALGDSGIEKVAYNPDKARISNILGMMAEMEHMISQLPEDVRAKMQEMHEKVKGIMKMMDSGSSVIDEEKVKETQEKMPESILVDGAGYTPEMIKKLAADSAALAEAQNAVAETKKLLDAKEAKLVEMETALKASEAKAASLQAKMDSVEEERRAPLVKKITDAVPALKAEDLKSLDMKRLTDTVEGLETAAKLKQKNDALSGKTVRQVVDDAYARKGKGGK